MKTQITELTDDGKQYELEAWRICRAWKKILGINLNMDRVAKNLRDNNEHYSAPTPLVDKILAGIDREKAVVLAEIKEPGGNRARKGDAHETDSASALEKSVFED